MIPVYIAGSSKELDRVDFAYQIALKHGFAPTYRWTDEIRAAGKANDLPLEEAREASGKCLSAILMANLVIYLVPDGHISAGAMFEVGFAFANHKPVYTIGHEPSIFSSLTAIADGDIDSCFAMLRSMALSVRPSKREEMQ